jgi:hypothetical protein
LTKKVFNLHTSMVDAKPTAPAKDAPAVRNKQPTEEGVPLNFRVASSVRTEFRHYAARHEMRMHEVLVAAFEALLREEKA